MLPITIMGNMSKESIDNNLAQYLVSTYGTKIEKKPKIN